MIPARIQRMPRRRQKIALVRYLHNQSLREWSDLLGRAWDLPVRVQMANGLARIVCEVAPVSVSTNFTIHLPDGTQKKINGATLTIS